MSKPRIGQIVYSLNIGNAARHCKQELTPVTVMSVGRKYFTASPDAYKNHKHMWTQYCIDGWCQKTDYASDSVLYETEQEWEDEKESKRLCLKISCGFVHSNNVHKLSLEKLKDIVSIMEDANGK